MRSRLRQTRHSKQKIVVKGAISSRTDFSYPLFGSAQDIGAAILAFIKFKVMQTYIFCALKAREIFIKYNHY